MTIALATSATPLVAGGRAVATIRVREPATPGLAWAAAEFQRGIRAMTVTTLPIEGRAGEWLVGDPAAQDSPAIRFRYNVRYLLPIRAFLPVVRNILNFHSGRPYWERVDWNVIDPPSVPHGRPTIPSYVA